MWSVLFQIINYLALLDFGFEKAIINFVASALGRKDDDGVSRVIGTSMRLYLWFGTAALALSAICSWLVIPLLHTENLQIVREGQIALVIIGLFAAVRFWFTPVTAALGGFQRYDSLTVIQVIEDLVRTIVMIVLLRTGSGLVALALTVFILGLIRQLVSAWWLKRVFPAWRTGLAPEPELTRDLFSYSRITFAITLAWMIIFNTDSMLLGLVATTAAAGIYTPATQLATSMRQLINAIGTPLTAAVAHARGARETESATLRYLRLFAHTSYGAFAIMVMTTLFAGQFVQLWLPRGFEETSRAMVILATGSAVFIPHILSNAMLFALNRHRYLLIIVSIEAGLKLLLALVLVGPYGSTGIALANAIPQIVLYTAVYPFLVGRAVHISPGTLLGVQLRAGVWAVVFTAPIGMLARFLIPTSSWSGLVSVLLVVAVCALAGLWFTMSDEERLRIRSHLTPGVRR
jgi:O-antigen/teichoic acid export membrane protein